MKAFIRFVITLYGIELHELLGPEMPKTHFPRRRLAPKRGRKRNAAQ